MDIYVDGPFWPDSKLSDEENQNMLAEKVYESIDKCCGCAACMNVCPKKAITMEYGDDGISDCFRKEDSDELFL